MFKVFVTTLMLFCIFCSERANATNLDEYEVIFCDSCDTESSVYYSAKQVNQDAQVLVFNMETNEVRAFRLVYYSYIGYHPINISVPSQANEAISLYHEVKRLYLESSVVDSQSTNITSSNPSSGVTGSVSANNIISGPVSGLPPFGLICGPSSSPMLAGLIPDGIFSDACQNHDSCYESGAGKGLCDAVFRTDLETAARLAVVSIVDPIILAVIEKALLEIADFYADQVVTLEGAHDAYCDISGNASSFICQGNPYTSGSGASYYQESSSTGYTNSHYFSSLWYKCFSYNVTYTDGSISRLQQCEIEIRGY